MNNQLWGIKELAAYLGIPQQTLYQWRTKGYGPPRAPNREVRQIHAIRRGALDQRARNDLMARVWIYDLNKKKQYREAVKNAKAKGRKPPARWRVMWYDNNGDQKNPVARHQELGRKPSV
jgi:hypothetical protein